MKNLFYPFGVVAILFASCSNEPELDVAANKKEIVTPFEISSPIAGVEIPVQTFTVNPAEGMVINLANGGSIEVPENAFVDMNGNIILEEVELSYQEFHSLTDIVLSGIPMQYDSAGVANNLVSAGMFTMTGQSDGKKVKIASDKGVKVNMASYTDTPCYNFYDLDESTGKWNYQTTKRAEEMPKVEAKTDIQFLDVEADYRHIPSLENQVVVGWYVNNESDQFTRSESLFLKHNKLNKVKVEETEEGYIIEVPLDGNLKEVSVTPYLMRDLNGGNELSDDEFTKVSNALAYQEKGRRGKVIRSIRIKGFGTYNWDIVHKRKNSQMLAAKFNVKNSDVANETVMLISPEENAMINYPKTGHQEFSFDPNKRAILVSIYDGNKLSVADVNQFDEAKKVPSGGAFEFDFKDTGIEITSGKDLTEALAMYF